MQSTLNQENEADSARRSPTEAEVWQQLAPRLDDALNELGETDRAALVLRFFENKTAREMADALRMNEDAAQKRVTRALEKLRTRLLKHGLTLTTTVIASTVASHAIQAAPVGLAATISAAGIAGATATTVLIMTTLQKLAVTAALTVSVGLGIYEAKEAAKARTEVQTLQQQQAPLAGQVQQLQEELSKATNLIAGLNVDLLKNNKNKLELLKLRGQVKTQESQEHELARFREENQKLSFKVADLTGWWRNYTNAPPIKNPYMSRDDWKETGTSEPLDALRTFLAAKKLGDQNRISEISGGSSTNEFAANLTRLPTTYWDKIVGIQVVDISINDDHSGQKRALIGTIIEREKTQHGTEPRFTDSTLQQIDNISQTIKRWFLVETNGGWVVTGFY